jgi:hypothetical protein
LKSANVAFAAAVEFASIEVGTFYYGRRAACVAAGTSYAQ